MYYLQSRYYNPESGRFINADALIGQTGELLGHNMFAYCKNNPVNMSDKNGFRPLRFDGEEITYSGQSGTHESLDRIVAVAGSIGGQGVVSKIDSAAGSYIGNKVASSSKKLVSKDIYLNNGNIPIQIQQRAQTSLSLKTLGKIGKIGIASTALLGLSAWDNYAHYQIYDANCRMGVDIATIFASMVAGALITSAAAALATASIVVIPASFVGVAVFRASVGIGAGANAIKDEYFGTKK